MAGGESSPSKGVVGDDLVKSGERNNFACLRRGQKASWKLGKARGVARKELKGRSTGGPCAQQRKKWEGKGAARACG
jgi:hypothetical protein